MDEENKEDESKVQADNNSIAIGGISIGGNVGDIRIGHTGYTVEEVSVLITQIKSTFQPKPFDGQCPYKGLDVFEEEDAELFFGREKLVDDLVIRVKNSRTLFVTGPSGSGKSSLVRAGLIYALKQGSIKNSERWLYETMKPGRDPIGELARVASSLASSTNAEDEIRAKALADSTIFARWCEIALKDSREKRAIIFIDQFEEVFTQINKEEERVAFLNLLTHAATVENGRVILIFSMRSDFVSNCATYPQLNALLNRQFLQIGAMQPDELVSAMAQPALRVGLRIDPDLIAQIINDMKGEPGALPLMQFTLKDLFDAQQAKGGMIALTLTDYLQHGGIRKSLERHADGAFAKLSESEQQLARSIFSGLIEIGRGTQDTKRTALFDELVPANKKAEDVEAIVRKLADARLITTDEQAGKDTVTISHEKLIDAWPWLKKLVNENRDAIALQNEITSDAKEWDEHKRDVSYLYSGARLANANEQLKSNKLMLSGTALAYIQAGQARQQRGRLLLISGISTIIVLLTVAVIVFSLQSIANAQLAQNANIANTLQADSITIAEMQRALAEKNAEEAQKQTTIALARQLAAQAQSINAIRSSKQMIGVLLSIQSMKLFPTDGAASFLLNNNYAGHSIAHKTHDGEVIFVAFSLDGKYVISAGSDKVAHVWEAVTGKEVTRITQDKKVTSFAFSPDGKLAVSGSSDNIARVWEVATGNEVARIIFDETYNDHGYSVQPVAFSPDGRYVVSVSGQSGGGGSGNPTYGNAILVWDAFTRMEVIDIAYDLGVTSVAFSPDGTYLAAGSEHGTVVVWETATGKEIIRMTNFGTVNNMAFSPDGKYVISGSDDSTARVWEALTGKEVARMITDDIVNSVAFSPDGRYVVAGSEDGTARVWEVATGNEVARMTHDNVVNSVAFSPNGKYVISGGCDEYVGSLCVRGTARVWEAFPSKEVARTTHGNTVRSVAFTSNGKFVVSAGYDNTARVWETTTGQEIARITNNGEIGAYAFSPDGKYIALQGCDDAGGDLIDCPKISTHLWETTTGREVARMIDDSDRFVDSFTFSLDGKYVALARWDRLGVWETTTDKEVARMTHDSYLTSVAFSPDGKYVVSGSNDSTARVWETATGKEIARMTHDSFVTSVVFSPDGKYVVSGSYDGTARVWEAATGNEVARMTHDDTVISVAFSPDGKYVVSEIYDTSARVWEVATSKEIGRMTHDSYLTSIAFSPDGKYVVSGSNDKTARVWEVATSKEIARMTHDDAVTSVAFSSDGKYVVSGSSDGTARVWFWQPLDLITNACVFMPRNLTRAEWKQYIGDALPYPTVQEDAVCPNLPIEPEPTPTP